MPMLIKEYLKSKFRFYSILPDNIWYNNKIIIYTLCRFTQLNYYFFKKNNIFLPAFLHCFDYFNYCYHFKKSYSS